MVGGEFFTNYGTIAPNAGSLYPKLESERIPLFAASQTGAITTQYQEQQPSLQCPNGTHTTTTKIQYIPIQLKRVLGVKMTSWLLSVYILFYVMYLVFGACVFAKLEGPLETMLRTDLQLIRTRFLQDHPCVPGNFFYFYFFFLY